jgi:hypothetical protein
MSDLNGSRLESGPAEITQSRHLSSYNYAWVNVCIRVTVKRRGTTAMGAIRPISTSSSNVGKLPMPRFRRELG